MNIKKLKIGQKVFIQSLGENDTEQETVTAIDIKDNTVWLSDGHPYDPNEIFSTRNRALNS